MQEKRLEGNTGIYFGVIDLENAYDRISKEVVYWCLRKKEMYRDPKTKVRSIYGDTLSGLALEQGNIKDAL